jgi:hypothetical protein
LKNRQNRLDNQAAKKLGTIKDFVRKTEKEKGLSFQPGDMGKKPRDINEKFSPSIWNQPSGQTKHLKYIWSKKPWQFFLKAKKTTKSTA